MRAMATLSLLMLAASAGLAQHTVAESKMSQCPMHANHADEKKHADGSAKHGAAVDGRHDSFGMSHEATRHTFRLFRNGGAIELRAIDANDTPTVESIRAHIKEIQRAFARGDFATPAFVHGDVPAGVPAMKKHHGSVRYTQEKLDAGARILISTRNPDALAAVHEFMKFQIVEHRTGDSGMVEE